MAVAPRTFNLRRFEYLREPSRNCSSAAANPLDSSLDLPQLPPSSPSLDPSWPLGQWHILLTLLALKRSMRLNNKTFKIGTLRRRRRREIGKISNFKWLGAALNLVEIKNPFGSIQTNPQAYAWRVPLFIFLKKVFFLNTLMDYHNS